VAITNAAADTLTRSLAVELAPIRVNAISPGVIDTGAWDALGTERKEAMFAELSQTNPARRIGGADDIASAAVVAMANTFMTGLTIHVDGGERLV
jgi:NAD(P)-dependent dehydrogenase (short-subunit alcohol dehydrogenase family)